MLERDPTIVAPGAVRLVPRRRRISALTLFGPAFVASVAYVDPGNLATDVTGGARFGNELLWVVVLANLIAMLVQYLSAKLGIATGRNLSELCRERYRPAARIALWSQAELIIIMTDLAEVVGGALGLRILFGVPLPAGGVLTALGMLLILLVQQRGRRAFEAVVVALLSVVLLAFLYQLSQARLSVTEVLGGLSPRLSGPDAVLLACGIVGATVMPHAIYLHGGLTQQFGPGQDKAFALRMTRWDVVVALGLAGLVNIAILLGATVLRGHEGDSLITAHAALAHRLGVLAGDTFGIALLASGLAASAVGVYSGQIVMRGFLRRSIPLWLRRVVAAAPAVAILVIGVDPTKALVASQVALSFGLPFALIPLLIMTRDRKLMGKLVNRKGTALAAGAAAALIIGLNAWLVVTAVWT
ncbi:MAG TPA: Nramp family divalent metal transporter [Pseudonocardiaceae bacterium]|nr:Nramp family divalent metal transporter [Pseudonocardiaceae bacterium]